MPYCPKCRGEFQDWVKTCLDCGVPLVDKLPPEPEKKEPESLIPVATFMYPMQAEMAKGKLESLGIPAFIEGESVSQRYYSVPRSGIKVVVRESDLMRATMLLKGVPDSIPDEELSESESEYYHCPKCSSTNINLKCCDCGHEWHEEEPEEPEETEH